MSEAEWSGESKVVSLGRDRYLVGRHAPPGSPSSLSTVLRFRLMLVREADLAEAEPPSVGRPELAVDYLWRHVFHDEPREVVAVLFADSLNRATGNLIASLAPGGTSRFQDKRCYLRLLPQLLLTQPVAPLPHVSNWA